MKKVKRKFDFMMFEEYGFIVDAEAYTLEEAKELYMDEYGLDKEDVDEKSVETVYVRWKPKMSREDMWYMDIYDNAENRGIYQTCEKEDKKAFKCWRLF